ncbi:MAG: amino acid adenylation domain-containing protein [Planctomycetota bacterium]|nr:amino acid adenylation domain-containing protein [Planctomycetota bacterium]
MSDVVKSSDSQSAEQKRALLEKLLKEKAEKQSKTGSLSYGQRALWFMYQIDRQSSAYNIMYAAHVRADVDFPALESAFQKLVNRHAVLRTHYQAVNGLPVQKVHPEVEVSLVREDARDWDWDELNRQIEAEADRPFDLEAGPVFRIKLYERRGDSHVFLFTSAHIASDFWSFDLLFDELEILYRGEITKTPADLPPIQYEYASFVQWQEEMLQGDQGQKLWDYWHKQLDGPLPNLDLPTDRPRPAVQTYRGKSHTFQLPDDLANRLMDLTREEGATPFMTLLAAYQILLYRYSGQQDILIGSPTAGRNRAEFEQIFGYFLNPVVLRARIDPEMTFRDFLTQVKSTVLDGLTYQDFPFPMLVERLQPPRDASRSPLFQASFAWDKPRKLFQYERGEGSFTPPEDISTLGLMPFALGQQGAAFDLTLMMLSMGDSLSAALQYNSDLFDESTILRMVAHFETLLQSIVADPDASLSALPLLSSDEETALTRQWNQTEADYSQDQCLHQIFEARAADSPDAIAVRYGDESLSYRELNARANQLANFLSAKGVSPETYVGIYLEPSPAMVVAILAIHKAGGAYVPLAPGTPLERIGMMLEESSAPLVLTQESLADSLPDTSAELVQLDADWESIARESEENPDVSLESSRLAYVIFTSGSTGKPKGVQIEHRSVVNFLESMRRSPGMTAEDTLLAVTTLSFDISVLELYLPLTTGASVVLVGRETTSDGRALAQVLTDSGITVMQATPATWRLLIEAGWQGDSRLKILCGGEAMPRDLAEQLLERSASLWNMYGPTETTIWSAVCEVEAGEGPVPVGKPIENTQIYILDEKLHPVPVGVPGHLHIGGDGLARGYLNRPELTAEKFIPDPFDGGNSERIYKTGDLAKFRPDGTIDFLGRLDFQVKVQGHRIELGEIESQLNRHPQIKQSVVMARQTGSKIDDKQLVAYTIADGESPNVSDLRDFLRKTLPDYMLPSIFMSLDTFPLNPAGKVDRKALPEPESIRPALRVEYVAPRDSSEEAMASIWSEALGVDQVGVNDNFFELGGASIQSLEIADRAAEEGLDVTPAMLFQYPTVAELAAAAGKIEAREEVLEASAEETVENRRESARSRPQARGATEKPARHANTMIESLGVYLPPNEVSTKDLIGGCKKKMWFPLEYMTGIKSRRMAGEEEFSIDLAEKAVNECLSYSKYKPEHIDLIVCCNITRSDSHLKVSIEPNTSLQTKKRCGLTNAIAFDITNACAGMFTGMQIVDSFISAGLIRRGMVVSGEFITGITRTAQLEITEFLDPRLACLTVGDAGAAIVMESSGGTEVGFHELDMYTLGKYAWMCIGRLTEQPHGGAIMIVPDPMEHTSVAVRYSVTHAKHTLDNSRYRPEQIQRLIMHQTSERSLLDGSKAINKAFKKKVSTKENTINNLAQRGNTASTSHMVALWDNTLNGTIQSGENVVFGITGSGQTIGTAIYTFDDLPDRLRAAKMDGKVPDKLDDQEALPPIEPRTVPRIRISSAATFPEREPLSEDSVDTAVRAAEDCLAKTSYEVADIELLIFAGITRTAYVSEPALAAMVAGKMKMNDVIEDELDKKTFAFDVYNGAMGFLNACQIASEMIRAGKYRNAMIVTSEVEVNREMHPDRLLEIAETGSAIILDTTAENRTGFSRFDFHYDCDHIDARRAIGGYLDGKPCLDLQVDANLNEIYLQMIPDAVESILNEEGLELSEIDFFLPPQISPEMNAKLPNVLGVEPHRFVDVARPKADLFTSALPYSLEYLQREKLAKPGQVGLVIHAASGLQVGCAIYYF